MGISVEDFGRCCRCCLSMVDGMQPLFGACLNEMLTKLMHLQVTPVDGYPQQMCSRCILKLSSSYTFYTMVQKNQKTLEGILKVAVENGETCASNKEKVELNTLGSEVDKLEKNNCSCEACLQPVDIPKETISKNQPKKIPNISVKNNAGRERTLSLEGEEEDVSDTEESYQCSQCKYRANNGDDLKTHLETHVGARASNGHTDVCGQLCNICGARFRWRTSLHKHLRQHASRHRCIHCHKTFAEASSLKVHLVSHSSQPKPHRCRACGRRFSQLGSRNKHARQHCAGQKPLAEPHNEEMDCSNMERPVTESVSVPTVRVEFLCLLCSTKFQSRDCLRVHICTKEKIT